MNTNDNLKELDIELDSYIIKNLDQIKEKLELGIKILTVELEYVTKEKKQLEVLNRNTNELKDYNLIIKKRTLSKFKVMIKQFVEHEYDLYFDFLDNLNNHFWESLFVITSRPESFPESIFDENINLFFNALDKINQESWEAIYDPSLDKYKVNFKNLRENGYTDVTDFLLLKPEVISKDIQIDVDIVDKLQKAVLVGIFAKFYEMLDCD